MNDENRIKNIFSSKEENAKLEWIMKNVIDKNIDKMSLSIDKKVMNFLEVFSSALMLAFNKEFPEPNYSIYITYRIKSFNSDIEKLENYLSRMKQEGEKISVKEISDLIGIRIIIEKIPHNISISKNNPHYNEFNELMQVRKKNIEISSEFHEVESDIKDGICKSCEYYTKSKELINNILNILNSKEKEDYALDLKETYNKLLKLCDAELEHLTIMGEENSAIDYEELIETAKEKKTEVIDFIKLLADFDSRIDSRLALRLYSDSVQEVIENSNQLNALGVSVSKDDSRTKHKREESGYLANFFGIDFKFLPLKCELQVMNIDEHLASTIGYSAHSNMPGKNPECCELPPAYVQRMLKQLGSIGKDNILNDDELKIIRIMLDLGMLDKDKKSIINDILSKEKITREDGASRGINVQDIYLPNLAKLNEIDEEHRKILQEKLYREGCIKFNAWAQNISAIHVTARLDKDSSVKNRVKLSYDGSYERLAHVLRKQVEGYNIDHASAEFIEKYLERVYQNEEEWLNIIPSATKNIKQEKALMDFEIDKYIKTELPKFIEYIKNYIASSRNDDEEQEK